MYLLFGGRGTTETIPPVPKIPDQEGGTRRHKGFADKEYEPGCFANAFVKTPG